MGLLILPHPLRADINDDFHFIGIAPMVDLFFFASSLTYEYSVGHLNPAYR